MTKWYLSSLRTVLIATTAALVALVPLTAFAQTSGGFAAADPSEDGSGKIVKPTTYARGSYIWPYASGPAYGNADAKRSDLFIAASGSFNLQQPLNIPQELRGAYRLDSIDAQHFVVQFHPDLAVYDDLRRVIEISGGAIVDNASPNTFVARLNAGAHAALQSAVGLTALEPYHAAFKLSDKIGRTPLPDPVKALSDAYELRVQIFDDSQIERTAEQITAMGGTILRSFGHTLIVELHRSNLRDLAAIEQVQKVTENVPLRLYAEETTTTMQTGQYNDGRIPYHTAGGPFTNPANIGLGIDGGGGGTADAQILMIIDSGISLDAGDLSDERASAGDPGASHRKVLLYETTDDFGGNGDLLGCDSTPSGGYTHGHTVAATALGRASDVKPGYNGVGWLAADLFGNFWKLDGVAPGAILVAYDAEVTPGSGACGNPLESPILPGDMYDPGPAGPCPGLTCPGSLGESYNLHGARTFNFSFGIAVNTYDEFPEDIDTFINTNKDAMVFVAAGNDGTDIEPDGGDGIPDEGTLGSPATTKNGLAVGASRNADTTDLSVEGREGFSSMGPAVNTTINRIAPQVMAPGGEPPFGGGLGISSEFNCRSDDNDQTGTVSCDITSFHEGTSFASPAAAGAALIVRDYFAQGYYPNGTKTSGDEQHISGGALKALLIASTDFMTGANLTRPYRWNNEQGYGRIQLDNALPLEVWSQSPTGLIMHDPQGDFSNLNLSSGISNTTPLSSTTFKVCDDARELRVALAWIDRQNTTGSLFNDLNLKLTSPSGLEYRGNYFTDDTDYSKTIAADEDCGPIGAANPDDPNLKVEGTNALEAQWSLPICSNSLIQGTGLTENPFDNANPTEAIFLSPNPDDTYINGDEEQGPTLNQGTCIGGSDIAGPCGNNLDCMSTPPTCVAGPGLCVCENETAYEQPELGDWIIEVSSTGSVLGTQTYSVAIVGGVCLGSSVRFDRGAYTCNQNTRITVTEIEDLGGGFPDPAPTIGDVSTRTTVQVLNSGGTVVDSETNLTFVKEPAGLKFTTDASMTIGTARDPGNGVLDVRNGDTLRVVYADKDVTSGNLTKIRTNEAAVECDVRVNIGTVLFSLYGQDDNFGLLGGCERNARSQFEFGFPDRYMDSGETIYVDFLFDSAESVDLEGVSARLRCVVADTNSPGKCLPTGDNCDPADCGGTCDPTRADNAPCSFMTVLAGETELGFLPAGAAVSANFAVQMAGDGDGEYFEGTLCEDGTTPCDVSTEAADCAAVGDGPDADAIANKTCSRGQPVEEVDMLLDIRAVTSGKTTFGLVSNRQKVNVDEVSKFYSTDFPAGGTQVVDAGPGIGSNNDEIAFDPITSNETFQGNDYRFETEVYQPITSGKDAGGSAVNRNQNLLSPWNFDGNDGGFTNGLAGSTDEAAAASANIHNWGEDKNFNGVEDGECTLTSGPNAGQTTGVVCYIFGVNADARCETGEDCRTQENNATNGTGFANFDKNWGTGGGCGWQTKPTDTCSLDGRGCFANADCLGRCVATDNTIVSTFDACGTGQPVCPDANQCSDLADFPLAPCTVDADCGDGGVNDVCDLGFVSQTCDNNGGTCSGPAATTGGVWHTGKIGQATNLSCDGTASAACANFKRITGVSGEKEWFELLVSPVMEKVDQSESGGLPLAKIEITDWSWNAQINLPDSNVQYTWELDTDTETIDPLDIIADETVLNGLSGGYGAISEGGNSALTRGWPVFASPSACSGTGAPCETGFDCTPSTCNVSTTVSCNFDADCPISGTCSGGANNGLTCFSDAGCPGGTCVGAEGCNNPETCAATGGGTSVNGSVGGNREGDMGCFFEGPGKLPTTSLSALGLARPKDDDINQDGDGATDEFVQANGPYRNNDVTMANGPDMRFFTLEDIYLDTANTFQAAIGFNNDEGTPTNQAGQSYGLAIDDMVVEWREFTLEEDLTSCALSGSCAVIEVVTGTVFKGQTAIRVTVLDATPDPDNDCDLDGTLDSTLDCDGNGDPDLVLKATSSSEKVNKQNKACTAASTPFPCCQGLGNGSCGEIYFANQTDDPGGNEYVANIPISVAGDDPGTLFLEQLGASQAPVVTVAYQDNESDPITPGLQPCPNDVDPVKHGNLVNIVGVALPSICNIGVVGNVTTDNGDGDFFVDTSETVDMQITTVNNTGQTVRNCTARLFTNDEKVECILDSVIDLGDLAPSEEAGVVLSTDAFRWKLKDNVDRAGLGLTLNDALNAGFNVTISCDECDALLEPQSLGVALDIDLDTGVLPEVAWVEDFESGLGKFETENLDAGIPGNNNSEGLVNGDRWRCQYSDPDWPNSNSYGDDTKLDCFPGQSLSQADAVFWQTDGTGAQSTGCDGGRSHTGVGTMYYGICLQSPPNTFSSPLSTVESVRTTDPINLGQGSVGPSGLVLELKWWQQISLVDGTFLGITSLRSADGGVVQFKTVDNSGADTSNWTRLTAFQNGYDAQRYDFYFNCMFDPIDDGNDEDSFFDPVDPDRREGPSSTCFPNLDWTRMGDTDEAFAEDNIGRATTPPGLDGDGDAGIGTWVEAKVDLNPLKGRRIKFRYLVSAIKATSESHEAQFDMMLGQWYDDGWWIDDVVVTGSLTDPATFAFDGRTIGTCSGNDLGCVVGEPGSDPPGCGTCENVGAPNCGDTCVAFNNDGCTGNEVPFSCCTGADTGTCAGGAGSIVVLVETTPDNTGAAFDETLAAPGQAITMDASSSTGNCVNGSLQYQFSKGGDVLQSFSGDPVLIRAPITDTDYTVEVRCATDPTSPTDYSCSNSATVDVNVNCPTSGTLGFGNPQMVVNGAGNFSWPASFEVDAFRGDLNQLLADSGATGDFSSSVLATVLNNVTADNFTDGTVPAASGDGLFWLVKPIDEACNILNGGSWSFGGGGEVTGRDATIPLLP